MTLRRLQENWDEFGRTDPMWAILTVPGKEGGRWTQEEFFSTGNAEIDALLQYLEGLSMSVNCGRALDFGCGLGRLTQALARHFAEVVGVDIAPSMIDGARRLNRHGDRCRYVLNERDHLNVLGGKRFDLIYTNIVLQHIQPRYTARYLREFMRLLAPGGALVFQLPSERRVAPAPAPARTMTQGGLVTYLKGFARPFVPRALLRWYWMKAWYWQHHRGAARWKFLILGPPKPTPPNGPVMEMHAMPRRAVEQLLRRRGGIVVDVVETDASGPDWVSLRYCVTR
jgi:SAM-dependent methyltransferase